MKEVVYDIEQSRELLSWEGNYGLSTLYITKSGEYFVNGFYITNDNVIPPKSKSIRPVSDDNAWQLVEDHGSEIFMKEIAKALFE